MSILFRPIKIKREGSKTRLGDTTHYRNQQGELHRLDGPALIRESGREAREEYHLWGRLHRDDGAAKIWADGSFEHYRDGVLAGGAPTARRGRLFQDSDLAKEEWRNEKGQLHREDGAALTFFDGTRFYYRNDQLHRADGAAIERPARVAEKLNEPSEVWMLNGLKERKDGPALIYPSGACSYWREGKLHREDGPAMENMHLVYDKGYREAWLLYGKPSRDDGAAILDAFGVEYYYREGILHRKDGPAVIYPDAREDEYYLGGMLLTEKEWQYRIDE